MAGDKGDAAYLWDMLTAAKEVERFILGCDADRFKTDSLIRSAVERQIEIVGEAARHVSKEFKDLHPQIPWRSIIAQRHVLAHEYGDINHQLLWRVASHHIPELIQLLKMIVPQTPNP